MPLILALERNIRQEFSAVSLFSLRYGGEHCGLQSCWGQDHPIVCLWLGRGMSSLVAWLFCYSGLQIGPQYLSLMSFISHAGVDLFQPPHCFHSCCTNFHSHQQKMVFSVLHILANMCCHLLYWSWPFWKAWDEISKWFWFVFPWFSTVYISFNVTQTFVFHPLRILCLDQHPTLKLGDLFPWYSIL